MAKSVKVGRVRVDKKQISLLVKSDPASKPQIQKELEIAARKHRDKMIDEFNSHPVTVELEQGRDSENVSGTLNGYGNLFTFFGFDFRAQPITVLRGLLDQEIRVELKGRGKNGKYTAIYRTPEKEIIYNRTPFKWMEGRSWVDAVEKGLSGFAFYMYRENKNVKGTRSKRAFQAQHSIRTGGFKNTTYITSILRKLEKNLKNARTI